MSEEYYILCRTKGPIKSMAFASSRSNRGDKETSQFNSAVIAI